MFKISYDKKITMVQGDTGIIRMKISNYELSQGDEVRFAIVNKVNPSILLCQHSDKKIVLEKQVTAFEKDGSARIKISPYDTEYLQPGKYLYEIQVKTKDGRIDTVVPLTSFTLMDGSIQGEFGQTTPSRPEPTPSEIELRFKRLENEIIPELGNRVTNIENEIDSVSSSLDNKVNLDNKKIRVAGNPYGEGNNAIVGSVIANEGDNPRVPILTSYPPLLSKYTDRDGVAFYSGIRNRNKTLTVDGNGVVYTLNTVTVPVGVNLSLVKVGMIIDTLHSPNEFTGYIENIEGNVITVKTGWFEKIPTTGSTEPSIPPNGVGFDVDRVTKVWANNSNIFIDVDKDCIKGVTNESGCFNYSDNVSEIGVFDGVNFEKPIEYIFRARSRYETGKVKYGIRVEKNIETALSYLSDSTNNNLLESIIYYNFVKNDEHSFYVKANGEQNKLKLVARGYGNGQLIQTNKTAKVVFISKTISEDFSIVNPTDKAGEIMFVRNNGTVNQNIYIENNLNFISVDGVSKRYITLTPNGALTLVSDGTNWVVLYGDLDVSKYFSKQGGNIQGNTNVTGDLTVTSTVTSSGNLVTQNGNISAVGSNSYIKTAQSGWNTGHMQMGAYHLWVDASGRLRIKNSAPNSDTDGTIVGTQV